MSKDELALPALRPRGPLGIVAVLALTLAPPSGYAIVGRAERYDEFKEEDLEEFHQDLIHEERRSQLDRSDQLSRTRKVRKKRMATVEGEDKEAIGQELERLEKELLGLPKRDRFRGGLEHDFKYDSNISRLRPREEKGDSVFDMTGFTEFDLSGRKTDLRFELRGAKQWNIHFSEKDFWSAEERIRYRRKYFKKITQSLQSRISRHSEKTIEIDDNKVRWDSIQNTSFNYAFSRKLSINSELEAVKRLYIQEAFDQDSYWEASAAPSAFWNFTPKSRVSLGYKFGANRIRTKKGDTNSHEMHAGYFGQVTKKSSISLDIAHTRQNPRELETARSRTITTGVGFIYQVTPKTQATLQLIRSRQNSTSNVSQTATDTAATGSGIQVTKLDTFFTNDSISFSLNSRLTRKIQAVFTSNVSHQRVKAEQRPPTEDLKTRQFTFPLTLAVTYVMNRWMTLRLAYTFAFRTGNEKSDTYRSHLWTFGASLNF